MKGRKRTSLRTQLTVALVSLAIVPLLIMGLVLARQSLVLQQQQALSLQGETAQRVSTAVDSFIRGLEGELRMIVDVQGLRALTADEQQAVLGRLLAYQGSFAELALLDGQGRETIRLARLRTFTPEDLGERSGRDEFRVPLDTGQTYYSPVRFDQVLGEPLMTIAVPVMSDDAARVDGVLVADARLKRVWDVIAGLEVSSGTSVYIVGTDGRIIAHRNPSVVLRGARFAVPEEEGLHAGLDSPSVLLATESIRFGSEEFQIVAERASGEALNLAINTLYITAGLTVVALVVAVLAGLGIVRRILQPIDRLAGTVTAITAGDLSQQAAISGPGEIAYLATAFNSMTAELRQTLGGLEKRVRERTEALERQTTYLQASANVGAAAASFLNVDDLVREVVDVIRDRFGLYYVGLFLVETGASEQAEWAILQAGTGEAGQRMRARGHRIHVGEGMIGWSIAQGQARVAEQAGEDAVRLATAELPETRSEAALPLRSRGRVLGAITVQHTEPEAFDPAAIMALQNMADQVGVALDNARLFAESQTALEAERRAYGEISRRAWEGIFQTQPDLGYASSRHSPVRPASGAWQPEMAQAGQMGRVVQDDGPTVAVPIKIHDQVEGVIRFRKPAGSGVWTNDEIALAEALTEQLSTALEGARLYRDTQQRAARERLVGEVTARMRETLDVETVLRTAVHQIGEALALHDLTIQLATDGDQAG